MSAQTVSECPILADRQFQIFWTNIHPCQLCLHQHPPLPDPEGDLRHLPGDNLGQGLPPPDVHTGQWREQKNIHRSPDASLYGQLLQPLFFHQGGQGLCLFEDLAFNPISLGLRRNCIFSLKSPSSDVIAKLSLPASIGWVALSSRVRRRSSCIGDISTYLHYMMF